MKQTRVAVVVPTNKESIIPRIVKTFLNQTYKNKELLIVLNDNKMDVASFEETYGFLENVSFISVDENRHICSCLNESTKHLSKDVTHVVRFDDDDLYYPAYIEQAMKVHTKHRADLSGVEKFNVLLVEDAYIGKMKNGVENTLLVNPKHPVGIIGGSMILNRSLLETLPFDEQNEEVWGANDTFYGQKAILEGKRVYARDSQNFLYVRTHLFSIKQTAVQDFERFKFITVPIEQIPASMMKEVQFYMEDMTDLAKIK